MKKNLFVVLVLATFVLLNGCGKKDDTSTAGKDNKNQTSSNDNKTKTEGQNKTDGKDKKLNKSSEKKDLKTEVPTEWTELASNDGQVSLKLPSNWKISESTDTKLVVVNEDQTLGVTAIEFANKDITSDELLETAFADFDFEPDGEAYPIQHGDVEGYLSVARGNINGADMLMYVMSAVDNAGKGNYVVYIYTPTANFEKNKDMMEKVLAGLKIG